MSSVHTPRVLDPTQPQKTTLYVGPKPLRQRGPNIGKFTRGKQCRTCKADAWYQVRYNYNEKYPEGRKGYRCAPCVNRQKLAWKKKHPDRYREFSWWHRGIKITLAEHAQLLAQQEGACAVCKRTDRRLRVDHCHKTGIIRGLLCSGCNALAQDPILVRQILDYMEERAANAGVS